MATWDLLVLRPLGLGHLALGMVWFAPAVVLGAPGGVDSVDEAWDHFVALPGQNVFARPLGEL